MGNFLSEYKVPGFPCLPLLISYTLQQVSTKKLPIENTEYLNKLDKRSVLILDLNWFSKIQPGIHI